ncbi:hypothetical protein HWD99_06835 [Microbacterium sp. C5A9]|uniref:AbiTii domain-containing protein n=1 Tax=Microbacterium sp. C5A9 TaxID=2736663 RepID=UPI001F52AE37|nr:hypothetical protein [Microbacterium sp. C5A9]MCI1018331.1 hypothetical protein [Microbacterium sp. C5A9]
MTLLDDVIEQASDGDAAAMLRKLMIVAHRLGADSLLAWVKAELNGYEAAPSVPNYRGPFNVTVKAHIVGPFGAQAPSTLTRAGTPDEFGSLFEVSFTEPLAVLEGYAKSGDGIVYPWDPLAIGLYNGWIRDGRVPFIEDWGVFSAQRSVSQRTFQGLVDVVRTRALELALDLQAEFPNAGEKDGPTVDNPAVEATVMTIVNNIYGPLNGLAQGNNFTQKVRVVTGDLVGALDSARRFLDEGELVGLESVLAGVGDDDDKRGRLAKFLDAIKAGSITLATGVTTDLAAAGLLEIATQFFGW